MAERIASSASTGEGLISCCDEMMKDDELEQWSFTGGNDNSFAISVFLIFPASSRDRPFTRSVMYELEAMALPHPNVLNLTSEMMPFSSTRICSFITSPHLWWEVSGAWNEQIVERTHAGAPTRPVPTSMSFFGREPT